MAKKVKIPASKAVPNRIGLIRTGMSLSQTELGEMAGTDKGTISKLESGAATFTGLWQQRLSDALGVPISDLSWEIDIQAAAPIIGNLAPNGKLTFKPPAKIEQTINPGFEATKLTAIKVTGKTLVKYHLCRGDLIFYDDATAAKHKQFLDKECIVKLHNDTVFGIVTKGKKANTYNIKPPGGQLMNDTIIQSAHPVIAIVRA